MKRETLIDATPQEAWNALVDDGFLDEWFEAEVETELLGGDAMRIYSEGETHIEVTLEPRPPGARLVVVETTMIGGPTESAINLTWHRRLTALRGALAPAQRAA